MFRTALFVTTAFCASPLLAEDFRVTAPVKAVTVYPQGATLTREFAVDLPAGQHRILLPVPEGASFGGVPKIEGLGALTVGAMEFLPDYVTDAETVLNADQAAALAVVRDIEKQVQRGEDDVNRATAQDRAVSARIAFLTSISGASLDQLDADTLRGVGSMLSEELEANLLAQQAAVEASRDAQEALAKTRRLLAQARQDYARLTPPSGPLDMFAVTVTAAEATSADLSLKHLVDDAYWSAAYDFDLDVDGGSIAVDRKVVVVQQTGELWSDVALTLSTADPFAQLQPRDVYPNPARIVNPAKKRTLGISGQSELGDSSFARTAGAPLPEPAIAEETSASVQIDGLSITYDYPDPVSVAPGNGALVLALGSFGFEAEVFNQASPRFDETAFLMATFTNDQPEPILPGDIQVFRDGDFVGGSTLALVPAGEEATVSFGALEGLRLEYKLLNNDTGDRGLLSTSNTRRQILEFSVKNLSTEAETVETLFALPYAEQEDLSLKVTSRPAPDETDFEKRRGVGKWMLDLDPGESKTVTLSVDLSWPDGQQLIWRP